MSGGKRDILSKRSISIRTKNCTYGTAIMKNNHKPKIYNNKQFQDLEKNKTKNLDVTSHTNQAGNLDSSTKTNNNSDLKKDQNGIEPKNGLIAEKNHVNAHLKKIQIIPKYMLK